ncbi:hypothetical protein TS85_20885 [Sphingomonas hengshuiensis]|uniref:Mutator family transposase n=1 Tax=Sphingomonas hengshuiensis TaxID=1609977 RepID=A0A7U4JBF1_9SPHN|nr:hypothetical protein TS85_20885 [Sphingomonas hengshuiensis]
MSRRKEPSIPNELLDQLLAGGSASAAFDQGGLLDSLKKALTERALNAEMDHHLAGQDGTGNTRNGYGRKTVMTDTGKLAIDVPRDRQASFERNHEIAKRERFEARVGMHDDVRGHRVGKAEVIGGRDAVDEHAGLVAPRQRVDDGAGVWIGGLTGQAVSPGLVVESARDAADLLAARQPVQRLVDSLARPVIEEIDGRPGTEGGSLLHPTKDVRFRAFFDRGESEGDSHGSAFLIHMWTPPWQGHFVGMGLIGCFHMSGLFVRHTCCRWP